jgi:hypothetical protein
MGVTSRAKHPRKRRTPSPQPSNHDDTLAEVLEDYAAAYRLLDAGKLDGYAGKYVGIVNGAVVGAARDATALRRQISRERGVHGERIAVIHVFDEALAQG